MNQLIKKLLPGLLPLIVFIVADEIWGTKVGIGVAIGAGVVESIISWSKYKTIDRFVLLDTGLIIAFGLVSIILDNDLFFKLKPGIIGLILCAVLGLSAFSGNNLMLMMSQRYMKGVSLSEEAKLQFLRSLKVMFWLFLGHTLLVFYAAVYMSKEWWAFISGGLFYILFGVYFFYELGNKFINRKKGRVEEVEMLPLVNTAGKIIGKAPRSDCHKNKELLHPVVHMQIVNARGDIYLQKRAMDKLVQPGKWDTAVGGHIGFGESVELSLERECYEELGFKPLKPQAIMQYVWESEIERELVFVFMLEYSGPFSPNANEVDEGKFWSKKDLRNNLGKQVFTPNFQYELKLLQTQKLLSV